LIAKFNYPILKKLYLELDRDKMELKSNSIFSRDKAEENLIKTHKSMSALPCNQYMHIRVAYTTSTQVKGV
jgi:hypothetical protein